MTLFSNKVMGMPRGITDHDRDRKIYEAFIDDVPCRQLAERFGIKKAAVWAAVKRYRFYRETKRLRRDRQRSPPTPDEMEKWPLARLYRWRP